MTILAANVRADAVEGITTSMAAKNLGIHIKRVTLIAQENGFKFADTPCGASITRCNSVAVRHGLICQHMESKR
ncbi:hypothetical protein ASD70_15050 [Pseudomonas sp. Root569]|nr:hypothetical protein ASD70_15050 [Pseudomonas sp. Root569]